jgi:hypothetical protein
MACSSACLRMRTRRPQRGFSPCCRTLDPETRFIEPCVGEGVLVGHLKRAGHVLVSAYDLPHDARTKRYPKASDGEIFITNPPWARSVLHEIIVNLSSQAPTWLLLDADWMHTRQSIPFMPRLRAIVSVGRLKWIPGSPHTGKDNVAWILFDRPDDRANIRFIGRGGATGSSRAKAGES